MPGSKSITSQTMLSPALIMVTAQYSSGLCASSQWSNSSWVGALRFVTFIGSYESACSTSNLIMRSEQNLNAAVLVSLSLSCERRYLTEPWLLMFVTKLLRDSSSHWARETFLKQYAQPIETVRPVRSLAALALVTLEQVIVFSSFERRLLLILIFVCIFYQNLLIFRAIIIFPGTTNIRGNITACNIETYH
ncbi:hypothetical protein FGO68_gene13349 [Halteria grandinella]|uniref:Uncharacterized protein n=1 Tax=Halteria grandinella TaxID=5974 RepID=A0A8J8NKN6_HALGN|nr:hypothetical protein FGO68_gene13349 [Halteria grandinella]